MVRGGEAKGMLRAGETGEFGHAGGFSDWDGEACEEGPGGCVTVVCIVPLFYRIFTLGAVDAGLPDNPCG